MTKREKTKAHLSVSIDCQYAEIINATRGLTSKSMFVNELFRKYLTFQNATELMGSHKVGRDGDDFDKH